MPYSHHSLDPTVHQLLQEEWERLFCSARPSGKRGHIKNGDGAKPGVVPPHELSPVISVLPGLIQLVNESTDKPVNRFRPVIKRLILEQFFVDIGGDSIVDAQHLTQVKRYVELTVRVLVRIRQHGLDKEECSDAPVTPQMFG